MSQFAPQGMLEESSTTFRLTEGPTPVLHYLLWDGRGVDANPCILHALDNLA